MRYLRSQRHVLQAILCPTMILHGLLFSPSAQAGEVEESLRNRIEDLRSGGNLQIEGVSIAATKFLMGFYEKRGFAPAWTDSRNVNALLGVLAHIGQEGLDPEDYLLSILRQYTTRGDGIRSLSPRQRADMDINHETIQKVIQSNKTQTVTIPKQIPVLLLYWTAEVGEDGVVNFRKDIYGRDAKILVGLRSHFTFRSAGNTR